MPLPGSTGDPDHGGDRTADPTTDRAGSDHRAFLADGAALGLSAIVTALVGLLGWLLAARIVAPSEVGRASAFVNGFVFSAGVAELGLGQACLKWLPRAGEHTRRILGQVLSGVLVSSVVVALVWGLLTHDDLRAQTGLAAVAAVLLFLLASVVWTFFHVQNFVLTSLGAARWVPVEMISFGVARIALLVVLTKALGALGIVLSWILPTVVAVLAVQAVLVVRRHRRDGRPGTLPDRREAARTAGSIYVSTFGMTLMISLVPLVVTASYGPAVGAVFFIVWNGVAAVELAAAGFGSALVVRLTGDSLVLLRGALRQVLPLFGAPLVVAALAASPLLHLFGESYAEVGTSMLRWVCVGLLLRVVGVMVVAIHLEAGRTLRLMVVNAVPAVAMIATIAVLPDSGSLTSLGVVYVVVQLVVTLAAVVDLRLCAARDRAAAAA